jgi:hypothetical protein
VAALHAGAGKLVKSPNRLAGFGWRPDGVMLQLGQRSSERDVLLWVPSGISHNQVSPCSSPLTLSHWRECNELHFISSLPSQGLLHWGLQLITSTADFIRHFPHMSAVGARQHPQQGPLLSGSSGGVEEAKVADRRDPQPGCCGRDRSELLDDTIRPAHRPQKESSCLSPFHQEQKGMCAVKLQSCSRSRDISGG